VKLPPLRFLLALSGALLFCLACSDDNGESLPTGATAATPTAPDDDCGLSALPASTTTPDLSWNGWREDYSWELIEDRAIQAVAIVRGVVLAEVTQDVDTGLQQSACLWVTDVLRGNSVAPGNVIVVGWPAPVPFESGITDVRVGYQTGREYIAFLQPPSTRQSFEYPVTVDYATWLRDVYPVTTTGPGAAPSTDDVQRLIDLSRNSDNLSASVAPILSEYGLELRSGLEVIGITIPPLPDAQGTLYRNKEGTPDFIWRSNYNRVRDAIESGGYSWTEVASAPAKVAYAEVNPPDDRSEHEIPATFVFRDGHVIAAFLTDYSNNPWPLNAYLEVATAISASDAGALASLPNRAPSTVNLAEWFGVDSISFVRYKGGDSRMIDGLFETPESRQRLVDTLNRGFETHELDMIPQSGCDSTWFVIERDDGWSFSLTFESSANRFYFDADGFWVDASVEFAALVGIEPFSAGVCY